MDLFKIRAELMAGKSIYDLPLRVTYYARVSTDKDEQLNSLDNQIFYYEDFIQKVPKWTFVKGYVDEGISGTSALKREDFLRMINDGKRSMFDLILTKEISRFSRSTLDSIKYTQELLSYGVGVLFQSDNINTVLPDSELRLTIMSSVAQEEVRKLSERVRFGMKRSIEKERVLGSNCITGYTKNDGKLEIDEEQAEMVRELFSLYAAGKYGFKRIAHILHDKGYRNSKGGKIIFTTLQRIILNPKYKGYYCTNTVRRLDYRSRKQEKVPREEWVSFECKENIPPIVSEELWDKANEVFNQRSTYLKNSVNNDTSVFNNRYAFSGLMYCADHPDFAFVRQLGDKKKNRPTWVCSKFRKFGLKECKTPILVEKELYEVFRKVLGGFVKNQKEILKNLLEKYEQVSKATKTENEFYKFEKAIMNLQKRKEKLLDLAVNGDIEDAEFKIRNEKMNSEIVEFENRIKVVAGQKEQDRQYKNELEKISSEISKELNLDDNIDELIKLLIEKVIVSKIDGSRKKVLLKIYFKFGNPTEYKLGVNNVGVAAHSYPATQAMALSTKQGACGQAPLHKNNNNINNGEYTPINFSNKKLSYVTDYICRRCHWDLLVFVFAPNDFARGSIEYYCTSR